MISKNCCCRPLCYHYERRGCMRHYELICIHECVIEKQKRNPCLEYTNIKNGPSTNYGRIIRVVDLGSNFGRGKIFKRKKQKDRMNFHLLSWPIEHYLNTLVVLKITCLH